MSGELIYGELTYKIRGAVFNVYNTLGFGHKEKVYQVSLAAEMIRVDIPFEREVKLDVKYNNTKVGIYRPDFVVDGKIILELKATEFTPKQFETQLLQYLKTTGYQLGLLINFGGPRLYIKRLVN